jgi:glycerate 2-kinase
MIGDVAEVAARIAREAHSVVTKCVLAFFGEPTVRPPPGSGRGGRMQHLSLLLAKELAGEQVSVLAAGSDGHDGETDNAGAIVDGGLYRSNAEAIDRAIARFDSATCCDRLGVSIPAWSTGTNLADLVLVAVG